MINPSSVRIPTNFVLVLPDPEFNTYQMFGKETGILVALVAKDEKGNQHSLKQQHVPISGTVYAIPERLIFNADDIWSIQDRVPMRNDAMVRPREYQREIDKLRSESVRFNVTIDTKVGDKVIFEYTAHMECDRMGLWVDTDKGRMMLIKYDQLILAKRNDDIIMLNGYLLVENEATQANEIEKGILETTTQSGIILLQGDKKEKKTRSSAMGTIVHSGSPVKKYLDFRGANEFGFFIRRDGEFHQPTKDVKANDKILYDVRHARNTEYDLHQTLGNQKLKMIQRKDIYTIFE